MLDIKNERKAIYFIFFFVLIFFSTLSFLRYEKQNILPKESYDYISYLESSNDFNSAKGLVLPFKHNNLILLMVPIAFGLVSLFIFYLIISNFNFSIQERLFMVAIATLSPIFINSSISLTLMSFALPLSLLGIFLILKKRYILSCFVILFLITIYFPISLVISVILFFVILKEKTLKPMLKLFYSISLLIMVVAGIYMYPPSNFFINFSDMSVIISEFGTPSISTFALLIAILGIFSKKIGKEHHPLYLLTLIFFILSLIEINFLVWFSLILSIFGGVGAYLLYNYRWELKLLKNLTFMLVFYGLIFSALSFSTIFINNPPLIDDYQALSLFQKSNYEKGNLLTHQDYTTLIENLLEFDTISPSYSLYPKELSEIEIDTEKVFHSRNIDETISILDKYQIKYIFITKRMKTGLVWSKSDEGLLFIMSNSNLFRKLIQYEDVEIWEYKR